VTKVHSIAQSITNIATPRHLCELAAAAANVGYCVPLHQGGEGLISIESFPPLPLSGSRPPRR